MTTTDSWATLARAGQHYQVFSDLLLFAVTGADTDGAYTMIEATMPQGSGSPILHTHPQQETLYVVEGECLVSTITRATLRTLRVGPGGVVHIPSGMPHTVKNESAAPSKLLAVFSPAGIEQFITEIGAAVTDLGVPVCPIEPPTLEHLITVLARHQMTFIAPPSDSHE